MDSPCIKQSVCKVLNIFQCGKYLVAYVLKLPFVIKTFVLVIFEGPFYTGFTVFAIALSYFSTKTHVVGTQTRRFF